MQKKLLITLISIFIVTTFIGCGSKEEASVPVAQVTETVAEETPAEEVEEEPELTVEELDAMIQEEYEKESVDKDNLFSLLNEAYEKGSEYAIYCLAYEYQLGKNLEKDEVKASEYFNELLAIYDGGNTSGKINQYLASCYLGLGKDADAVKSLEFAEKGAAEGFPFCYAIMGNIYSGAYDGVERDEAKMFENYKAYCDLEKEDINYSYYAGLANCYFFGTGVEKDIDKGIEWATKAADGDDLDATVLLAGLYYGGNFLPSVYDSVVVPVDYDKALSYFEKAAELGHNDSSWVLARTYSEGIHIFTGEKNIREIDNKKALKHYEEIINSGKDISAYNEKNIYLYAGLAAYKSEDYKKAREYSEKSIEVGEPKSDTAQSNLNILDEKGL